MARPGGRSMLLPMRPRLLVTMALLGSALAVAVGAAPPSGAAPASCAISQLTETTGGTNFANAGPRISRNGAVVAFESSRDHTGQNADANQEIFRLVVASGAFQQVSNTTGGTFANRAPALDDDGTDIVFTSNRNIGGDNADNNLEIAHWTGGGMFSGLEVLTDSGAGSSGGATISADDAYVAFRSTGDLTGGNGDGSDEIFLQRLSDDSVTQVTDTTGGNTGEPALDATGASLAFGSDRQFGTANADGSYEVWQYTRATGTIRPRTTTGAGSTSAYPDLSNNGRRLAFASDGTFNGRNADGNFEAFLREDPAGSLSTLSSGPGGTFGLGGVAVSGAGTRVVFDSDDPALGDNADGGFEIYLRDFGAGVRTTQVTNLATGGAGEVDINGAGTRVVFSSTADIVGDNADGNREIFLATCSAPPAPVTCDGHLVTADRARGQQGSAGNDVIRGRNVNDTINAGGGNDRVCALNGNDTVSGGPGNDRIFGQAGADRARGDGGNDRLDGSTGPDVLNGGPGSDTCLGGPGPDSAAACEARLGIP